MEKNSFLGNIYLKNVSLGDQTLTDIEIWTCEYQEVNVCLIYKRDEELLKDICKREKLCLDIIGETEKSESIIVYGKNGDKIVDLELDNILGKIPQKKYVLPSQNRRKTGNIPKIYREKTEH